MFYLTEDDNKYGILAIEEVTHPDSEGWDTRYIDDNDIPWKDMSPTDIEEYLKDATNEMQSKIENKVILGLYTGFHEQHEITVWLPKETTTSEIIEKVLDRIEDIKIYINFKKKTAKSLAWRMNFCFFKNK